MIEALKPTVILVEPQMPENIGAAARAMKNFGLSDLRLVRPRDGWPNPAALPTASHASDLIHAARVYDSVEAAVADLDKVYAATARSRFMHKPFVTTRTLPRDMRQLVEAAAQALAAAAAAAAHTPAATPGPLPPHASTTSAAGAAPAPPASPAAPSTPPGPSSCAAPQQPHSADPGGALQQLRPLRTGLMFGRESSGLTNEEVALANTVLTIEADPVYPVLNLAQAIVVTSYELHGARLELQAEQQGQEAGQGASQQGAAPASSGGAASTSSSSAGASSSSAPLSPSPPSSPSSSSAPSAASASASSAPSSASSPPAPAPSSPLQPATRGELEGFMVRLVAALDGSGFFESDQKRPATLLSIRTLAGKVVGLTVQEVALLHGMLSKLLGVRKEGRQRAAAGSSQAAAARGADGQEGPTAG